MSATTMTPEQIATASARVQHLYVIIDALTSSLKDATDDKIKTAVRTEIQTLSSELYRTRDQLCYATSGMSWERYMST